MKLPPSTATAKDSTLAALLAASLLRAHSEISFAEQAIQAGSVLPSTDQDLDKDDSPFVRIWRVAPDGTLQLENHITYTPTVWDEISAVCRGVYMWYRDVVGIEGKGRMVKALLESFVSIQKMILGVRGGT
eukprot:Protomagalhaensia_sp_Gyna_25__4124@NODE_3739_length_463_cov_9_393868_g3178_i0_p1_GENE_NODE_3739_length_463_cov_9_393868_g3178_i0NODE_3739_length_463_cov_9_393868_g3178_i0_p1_ORF_typecomplete_len131_score24_42_NODE_3739_length_463_cov_9_393868_g3178_i027419